MDILLSSAPFWISALLAAIMGFAIQRGATCTVAAVDEFVTRRRANRLLSMIEASLWVTGGLLIAQVLHVLPQMPSGYALNGLTIVGAILLGVGAYINGACVFGAIARLGSGEWAYAVTPMGFYVGCLTVGPLFSPSTPERLRDSPVLQASMWLAAPFVALMVFRILRPLVAGRFDAPQTPPVRTPGAVTRRIWSPHTATAVIGITFFLMLLLVGAWAYTDVLADLAHGMAGSLAARSILLVALFAGALVGGYTAGRFHSTRIGAAQLAKCFAGGVLMAWGSLLIPGSNDGLILIGLPLLRPYAWVAFLTMCVSIAVAMLLRNSMLRGPGKQPLQHG